MFKYSKGFKMYFASRSLNSKLPKLEKYAKLQMNLDEFTNRMNK